MRPRYDVEALEHALFTEDIYRGGRSAPDTALAEAVGVTRGSVIVARKRGLNIDQADKWAIRGGIHPSLVWPSWFADALADDCCDWCGIELPFTARNICGRPGCRKALWKQRSFDNYRLAAWWKRLDSYREAC